MAVVLEGKKVVSALRDDMARRIAALEERGVVPKLAIVRVGERLDDLAYERAAVKRAEGLGIAVDRVVLGEDVSEKELSHVIERVNGDEDTHGCLLLRPFPSRIDETRVCNLLACDKDVDGITRLSLADVFTGEGKGFPPATAQACLEVLDFYGVPMEGRHVVVVGRSLVVGKPVAMMLLDRHASVTVCHSRTEDLPSLTRKADIVICATGRPRAFGADHFSPGQTVLDVGINFDAEGNLCGDVEFAEVESVVGALTPVPGGIGSVTTSVTMDHVVRAAERSASLA